MIVRKLFNVLDLLGEVNIDKWSIVMKLVESMSSIEVKEKKWDDSYKQNHLSSYPLDLTKLETWSTFDGECVKLVFSNRFGKFTCDVSIYDGDNMHGRRRNLRFTAILILPNIFIKEIEDTILYRFDNYSEQAYRDHLLAQKELWMSEFKNQVLKL